MSDQDNSVHLKGLIERANAGDANARHDLVAHAYDRLCSLAARMMAESFPALRDRHEVNSIVHETWLRLDQALDTAQPSTVADFFRFAAYKIRHVLLDMVAKYRTRAQREVLGKSDAWNDIGAHSPGNKTYDPRKLAEWTHFHQRVESLETAQREVFEMHFYLDIPQSEIATLLNLHPRKVSYLWVAATENLADAIDAKSF